MTTASAGYASCARGSGPAERRRPPGRTGAPGGPRGGGADGPMTLRADVAPSRRVVIAAGALVAACVTVFALIAEDVLDGGGLISRDLAVLTWFVDHRTPWLISAARLISSIGGFAVLVVLGLLVGGWVGRRGWHIGLAIAPLVSLVIGSLLSTFAKSWFARPRPPVSLHETTVTLAAFPSGHATDAAAFFLAAAFTVAITIVRRPSTQALLIVTALLLGRAGRAEPARAGGPLAVRCRGGLGSRDRCCRLGRARSLGRHRPPLSPPAATTMGTFGTRWPRNRTRWNALGRCSPPRAVSRC